MNLFFWTSYQRAVRRRMQAEYHRPLFAGGWQIRSR